MDQHWPGSAVHLVHQIEHLRAVEDNAAGRSVVDFQIAVVLGTAVQQLADTAAAAADALAEASSLHAVVEGDANFAAEVKHPRRMRTDST